MSAPRWLSRALIRAIHADQIREHAGLPGVREPGLLESALERPANRLHYEPQSDLADLAAALGYGIAQNHPFMDGNKRVAFQAMYVFLGLNGQRIEAEEDEVVRLILALASGELEEPALAQWLREHTVAR
jgi:death on curing protein